MKQYTTPEQTAKLIELGFKGPKSKVGGRVIYEPDADLEIEWEEAYSIGELIEMLPTKIEEFDNVKILQITSFNGQWRVKYAGAPDAVLMLGEELIDALYYMILELKAEGVI